MLDSHLLVKFSTHLLSRRFIFALSFVSLAFPSWGITFYVSPDGNDSWRGGRRARGLTGRLRPLKGPVMPSAPSKATEGDRVKR